MTGDEGSTAGGDAAEELARRFVRSFPVTGAAVSTLGDLLGVQTVAACEGELDGLEIGLVGAPGAELVEADPVEPGMVLRRPGLPAVVDVAVAQQQFRDPVTCPHQVTADVLTGPDQVPCGFLADGRDADAGDVVVAQQLGQLQGIAGVGLDPVTSRAGQL